MAKTSKRSLVKVKQVADSTIPRTKAELEQEHEDMCQMH